MFGHIVYGIQLTEEESRPFQAEYRLEMDRLTKAFPRGCPEAGESFEQQAVRAARFLYNAAAVEAMRAKHRAPDKAVLLFSGADSWVHGSPELKAGAWFLGLVPDSADVEFYPLVMLWDARRVRGLGPCWHAWMSHSMCRL